MKKIDIDTWNRKEIYSFFSSVSNPFYMVSFTVDVTNLVQYTKKNSLSFYLSLIHLCTKSFNSIENFKYTLRGKDIFLIDQRNPSFTDMKPNEELFHITTVNMEDDLISFVQNAKTKSENQNCFIEMGEESDELIFFSCLPELRMTSLTNERDILNPNSRNSNIPSISWGKYTQVNDRYELNISLEVNHRFIDGLHITRFSQTLEKLIREL